MAVRTTEEEVKKIIETNLSTVTIESYITTANVLVNNSLSGQGLSETLLTEIEKYITAHLIAFNSERQAYKKSINETSETYGVLGKMLEGTTYGQTALMLDASGLLSTSSKTKVVIQAVPQFDDSELLDED